MRLIEEPEEYRRVRRLHPRADESLLRARRDNLEDRFATASELFRGDGHAHEQDNGRADWLKVLDKWDDTLSNALQLAPQKGVYAGDLDAETERLYADHVAPERAQRAWAHPEAAESSVPIARRFCGRPGCGNACRKESARRSSPSPEIPCASIMVTAAMAPEDSCRR